MKLLLDEQVPVQFGEVLRLLLPRHKVDHVQDLNWKSKRDIPLMRDAKNRGYKALLTNDLNQLNDPDETAAIRKSGLHHIRYRMPPNGGMKAFGRAFGSVAAALPLVVEELESASGQRLVEIVLVGGSLSDRRRIVDPKREPPKYWR